MILSIFGIALMLSRLGVIAYVVPALSRSYLNGNLESIRILDRVFAGPLEMVDNVSSVSYSVGFFLFGIAVWRSGTLPRWAGVLLAIHAPLITGPFSVAGSVTGALLALMGGAWIALSSMRVNPGQADSATILRVR